MVLLQFDQGIWPGQLVYKPGLFTYYHCIQFVSSNKSSPPRLHINWRSGSTTPSSQLNQATPTTIDADTLRAILSAQAAAQEKMLQAVMKKMQA
ncbi:unnamed protein product [Haemonchus placei]|uniref:Uncharacterized protein n=1 Tax=Haemonchus placei TaxID=6290 RepID=A0A3P7YBK1_HAEPC|nr:unnamed protein product [Haemonchus placei]